MPFKLDAYCLGNGNAAEDRLGSSRSKLQTVLQCPERIERIVQGLVLFDGVIAGREKLTCPGDNCLFSVHNPSWDKLLVVFKEGSEV
jgi:hypothetical protein